MKFSHFRTWALSSLISCSTVWWGTQARLKKKTFIKGNRNGMLNWENGWRRAGAGEMLVGAELEPRRSREESRGVQSRVQVWGARLQDERLGGFWSWHHVCIWDVFKKNKYRPIISLMSLLLDNWEDCDVMATVKCKTFKYSWIVTTVWSKYGFWKITRPWFFQLN